MVKYINNDKIIATICQEPYKQGYTAINLLFEYTINNVLPNNEYCFTNSVIKIKENIE